MEKLLALLAKGQFDFAEDQGDEDIELNFILNPVEGGVDGFVVNVELDELASLELKKPDGTPVDFSEIYDVYGRDSDGNEIEDEDEDEDDARDV